MTDIDTRRIDVLMRQNLVSELPRLFQEKTPLLEMIMEGKAETMTTKGIEFVMNVLPAGPSRYGGEAAAFPNPLPRTDVKGRSRYFTLQRTIGLTGHDLIHMTKLSDAECIEDLSTRIGTDMSTAKKGMNQMGYGDGTGEVAKVGTNGPAPGTVTSAVYMSTTVADGNTFGAFKFVEGTAYNFYTAPGVLRADGGVTDCVAQTVTLGTANTVTFDNLPNTAGTPTVAATDIVVAAGDWRFAPNGLDYHFVSSGVRQNLSLDTFRNIRATIIQAGGAYITAPVMSKLKHEMYYRVDDDAMKNLITLSAPSQHYLYEMNGHPIRRAAMSDRKYDGGYEEVEYDGGKWGMDPDCPRADVYRWTKGDIERGELFAYNYWEIGGNNMFPRWGGTGSYGAGTGQHMFAVNMYFLAILQFFCRKPNRLSVIRGLSMNGAPVGNNV